MRRAILPAILLAWAAAVITSPGPALAGAPSQATQPTHEVCVGTTPTQMLAFTNTVQAELQVSRAAAGAMYCARGSNTDGGSPLYPDAGAVDGMGKAHEIQPGATWTFPTPGGQRCWCLAAAVQDAGACTIVDESPQ